MGRSFWRATRRWAADSNTVRGWREARYSLFVDLCDVQPGHRILDAGAGGGRALERFNETNEIVALDISPEQTPWLQRPNVSVIQGDATRMPFPDRSFDVVFSNSVIEHIPRVLQPAFAAEVRRVGKRYFVQTPNRHFPIEPHYQFPLFQFLPSRIQRFINRHVTLGWREKGNWEPVNLLTRRSLQQLFPDAEIHREKLFGLTKSLMAVGVTADESG